jgi:hypothetical protein
MIAVVVLVFLFSIIAEAIMYVNWTPIYFKRGIPVYTRAVHIEEATEFQFPTDDELNRRFNKGFYRSSLVFSRIDDCTLGIKDKPIRIAPVLHGSIQFNPLTREVRLKSFFSLGLSAGLIAAIVLMLPGFLIEVVNYGNPLVHLAYLLFVIIAIAAVLIAVSLYSNTRFRAAFEYITQGNPFHNPAVQPIGHKAAFG